MKKTLKQRTKHIIKRIRMQPRRNLERFGLSFLREVVSIEIGAVEERSIRHALGKFYDEDIDIITQKYSYAVRKETDNMKAYLWSLVKRKEEEEDEYDEDDDEDMS